MTKKPIKKLFWSLMFLFFAVGTYHVNKALPKGISQQSPLRPAHNVKVFSDHTYLNQTQKRQSRQAIFDEILAMIGRADKLIVVDMFLYNIYVGKSPSIYRPLSQELTDALLTRKKQNPGMRIVVTTDPINTVYGGKVSEQFEALKAAGIEVVLTDLTQLRDSNPLYSSVWRSLLQWFGNSPGGPMPNPFGEGDVSVRSYLTLLNFKANHRKVLIADRGGKVLSAMVTSANPHDGSSAHDNIAVYFEGPAAQDLLHTENAVRAMSGANAISIDMPSIDKSSDVQIQILTESKIRDQLLTLINGASKGEHIDIFVFYFSHREIAQALINARQRGVNIRLLLDPNKDAFGMEKNGVPNRPLAHELQSAGIPIRWCHTHGEQCHNKMLMYRDHAGRSHAVVGSANFTRRNLDDFNLETNVYLYGANDQKALKKLHQVFERHWYNTKGEYYSTEYAEFADESRYKYWLYRFTEATGLSTY